MIPHPSRRKALLLATSLAVSASIRRGHAQWDPARRYGPPRATHRISTAGAVLQVEFFPGEYDLTDDIILRRIEKAVHAVVTYYGRFPVQRARILIVPMAGRDGVHGTTWGDVGGWPAVLRIGLGQHLTAEQLAQDWTITHELVHTAFPSLPDDQHWMEEGLATYIEPIARVQAGELSARKIWRDMLDGMPKGEPGTDDQGLDRTHSWRRTYWGGALFCLVADVHIRVASGNHKGLQDALRGITAAGGTIDREWPLTRALEVGDKATQTSVLTEQYRGWSNAPVQIDLEKLWHQLGIQRSGDSVEFSAIAPYSKLREAITEAATTVPGISPRAATPAPHRTP